MQLIYFSPVPWASFRQRPHEFAQWAHERLGAQVLWVEPYAARLPAWQDLSRPAAAMPGVAVPPWLRILSPRALPLEPLRSGRVLNRRLFWPRLLESLRTFAQQDSRTVLVVAKPSDLAMQAITALGSVPSFYDAMDDFPAFHQGRARATSERIESEIVRRCKACSVTSSFLQRKLAPLNANVQLAPNGVAGNRLPAFEPAAATGRNFGYIGTLGPWFDWGWVAQLAASWPDRLVEIHGPVYRSPTVTLPSNVHLHPALPHDDALERMKTFGAGLIPFLDNELTASVDPVKFHEYRALGLAVVSTPFGEMRARGEEPRVLLTTGPAADRRKIDALLGTRDTAESVTAFRRAHDWSVRFEPLAALLAPST